MTQTTLSLKENVFEIPSIVLDDYDSSVEEYSEETPRWEPICWYGHGAESGGVYFIKTDEEKYVIKIGRSNDIKRRFGELRRKYCSHKPLRLKIVCVCVYYDENRLEKAFHKVFSSRRIGNSEWFDITVEDVKKFLSSKEVIFRIKVQSSSTPRFDRFREKHEAGYDLLQMVQKFDCASFLSILMEKFLDPCAEKAWFENCKSLFRLRKMDKSFCLCLVQRMVDCFPLLKHVHFRTLKCIFENRRALSILANYTYRDHEILSIFKSETIETAKTHHLYPKYIIPDSDVLINNRFVYSRDQNTKLTLSSIFGF